MEMRYSMYNAARVSLLQNPVLTVEAVYLVVMHALDINPTQVTAFMR